MNGNSREKKIAPGQSGVLGEHIALKFKIETNEKNVVKQVRLKDFSITLWKDF